MEKSTLREKPSDKLIDQYSRLQLGDFKQIKKLFEGYIFGIKDWSGIAAQLSDVLDKCDALDFEENETAHAYTVWHFLDRYHRFQIVIGDLWKQGYLCYKKNRKIDILEVGAGPAQGLFAFSEHYAELNQLAKEPLYSVQSDYVEQSNGFRNFLHWFVEYAMADGKNYTVPFHFGRERNAFDFTFEEIGYNWYGHLFRRKYRYDIVVINNFLTTDTIVRKFKRQLGRLCKYMRNYGILIIAGADDASDKYRDIYRSVDKIISRKFKSKDFWGWWTKISEKTFSYNYCDEYGELLREYYRTLKEFLISGNLWDCVPPKAKDKLESTIGQTPEKTLAENWKGNHWKVVVYQKHCFYREP